MKQEIFNIYCYMGMSHDWSELGLTKEEYEVINKIGHEEFNKRKPNYNEQGIVSDFIQGDYLNMIHQNKYLYEFAFIERNNKTFIDGCLITRINKTK